MGKKKVDAMIEVRNDFGDGNYAAHFLAIILLRRWAILTGDFRVADACERFLQFVNAEGDEHA